MGQVSWVIPHTLEVAEPKVLSIQDRERNCK